MTNRRVAKFKGGIMEMSLESAARKPIIAVVGTKTFNSDEFDPPLPLDLEDFAQTVGETALAAEACNPGLLRGPAG
jgi:hypothetical protein